MAVFYFRKKAIKHFLKACACVCVIFIVISGLNVQYSSDEKNGESGDVAVGTVGDNYIDIVMRNQTLRYWELVNRTNSTKPLFRSQLPNLWRPVTNEPLLSGADDRLLAQLIWAMEIGTEANNLSLTANRSLKMKTIYLPESFESWYQSNWHSPHILNSEDCPGNSSLVGKCAFSESDEGMDAVLTPDYKNNLPATVSQFIYKLESPYYTKATLRRNNDLLVAYYRGSDVSTPYGKWVYYDPDVRFRNQEKDYAKGKTKMAAILVSHCQTYNKRLDYVNELQKYIEVDVYGKCGKYCDKGCLEMLKRDYRFYLSFENSNCRDYITEKLFSNAYGNDMIPIVLGAHPDDYRALCPENSYIHVEDFVGPKELADYMKHLASNPSDYNTYFWWKGTGKFVGVDTFCRVCAMAHYADFVSPPERKSDYVWGHPNGLCLPRGVWYWNFSERNKSNL